MRYPTGDINHYPTYPSPHQIFPNPYIPTNGYNLRGFHPHTNAPFISTSTYITHYQTAMQRMSTPLSKDESYIKQCYFQQMEKFIFFVYMKLIFNFGQQSPNRRRSCSSSYSSRSVNLYFLLCQKLLFFSCFMRRKFLSALVIG